MEKWLEQYIELMFGPLHTRATMESAASIKFANMPKHLYKYRSFIDTHKQALQDGVLYSSPPSGLNDLTDTNLVITDEAKARLYQRTYNSVREEFGLPEAIVTNSEELIRISDEFFRKKTDSEKRMPDFLLKWMQAKMSTKVSELLAKYRNESRDRYNVCSFSAANDIDLMWTHYSSNHTGFCIEYDFKCLGTTADDVQLLFPVVYNADGRVFINDIDEVDTSFLMFGTTVKKDSWSYEKEWRRLFPAGKNSPHPMPKPTGLYLGAKSNNQDENWLKMFCANNKIPLHRMSYNPEMNRLVPIRVMEWK